MSGFSLPDDALHAPNESYRLVALSRARRRRGRSTRSWRGCSDRVEEALEYLRALPRSDRRAPALRENERFQRAVELVADRDVAALKELASAKDAISGAIGFEALARRPRDLDLVPWLRAQIAIQRGQRVVFLLHALDTHMGDGLVTAVLQSAGPGAWHRAALPDLEAIARRRAERVDVSAVADAQLDNAIALARLLGDAISVSVLAQLSRMEANRHTLDALRAIGRARRPQEVVELGQRTLTDVALEREIVALAAAIRSASR